MKVFSDFLYERRKALNLTQQDIADKLEVSNKAVSKWEQGECLPEATKLLPLAKIELYGRRINARANGGNSERTKNGKYGS